MALSLGMKDQVNYHNTIHQVHVIRRFESGRVHYNDVHNKARTKRKGVTNVNGFLLAILLQIVAERAVEMKRVAENWGQCDQCRKYGDDGDIY